MSSLLPTLTEDTLQIAAFSGFAPFAWDDNGTALGRDIDFLRRFAKEHGLLLSVAFHTFDRIWEAPGQDTADIAASGISRRMEESVAWSQPYGSVRRTLLIRAGDGERLRGMSDLGRIAVVPGSAAETHARETLPEGASLTYIDTLEDGVRELLLGRVDAVGTGSLSAEFHAGRHSGLAMVDVHEERPPERLAFAVRPPLRQALDEFIVDQAWDY